MRRLFRSALLVGGVVALQVGCGPKAQGVECGNSHCRAGTLCDPDSRLCVDNLEPRILILEPTQGAAITGKTLTVKGTITDDEHAVISPEITIDDGTTWAPITVADDGSFTAQLTLPEIDTGPLTVKLRARDPLDQEGTAQVKLTLDNVPPSCTLKGFSENQVFAIEDGPTVDLTWLAADGSGSVQSPKVQLDGKVQPLTFESSIATFAWTLPQDDSLAHTLDFSAVDPLGNRCQLTSHFTVDQVPPALTLTTPSTTESTLVGGPDGIKVTFQGTLDNDPDQTKTHIYVDFKDGSGEREVTARTPPDWQLDIPLTAEDYVTHEAVVRAVDLNGNETTLSATVIVDRVAPTLVLTAPTMNQKFNIADLSATGDKVIVSWTQTDGDKDVVVELSSDGSASTPVTGTQVTLQPPATDDGATHSLNLVATDKAGNPSSANVTFQVDRVAPVLTSFSAVNNTRMNPRELTLTFSSPVTFLPSVDVVSPQAGTRSGTGASYKISSLAGDTIYTASLPAGSVQDDFGNPNPAATPITFATEPAVPASGISLNYTLNSNNIFVSFEAASDEDGVVSVAMIEGTGTAHDLTWGEFNPKTGTFAELASPFPAGSFPEAINLSTHRELNGLSATRYRGYTLKYQQQIPVTFDAYRSQWLEGSTPKTLIDTSAALVPVPAGCADPPGDPVGYMGRSNADYIRSGATQYTQASNLSEAYQVAPAYADDWVVLGLNSSGSMAASWRHCGCSFPVYGCSFDTLDVFPDLPYGQPTLSSAYPGGSRGLAVYETSGGGRAVACYETRRGPVVCNPFCPPPTPPQSYTAPLSEGLFIAPKRSGARVIGARKTGSGVELLEYDLASGCPTSMGVWTSLGTAPNTSGTSITSWRPVMFAKKPGVIYQDGSTLKVWIP